MKSSSSIFWQMFMSLLNDYRLSLSFIDGMYLIFSQLPSVGQIYSL